MAEDDPNLPDRRNRPHPDVDFAAWITHQVEALKARRFDELDIEDLSEEVESLAKRDFKKLRSYLRVILTHMLKWDWQPERRDVSWRKSINASRNRVWGELASSPSFHPRIPEAIEQIFEAARIDAWEQTGVFKLEHEPKICPYTWEEIMFRPHELEPDRVPRNKSDPFQGDLSSEDD